MFLSNFFTIFFKLFFNAFYFLNLSNEKFEPKPLNLTGPLGNTKVFLNGDIRTCGKQECNLGNLITDAMIESNLDELNWTDAAIAIFNAGNIKSSISKNADEPIYFDDILKVLPLKDDMGKTSLTREQLFEMLEHSVAEFPNKNTELLGQFLQFSGIQVMYNLSKPVGSRVVKNEVYVRCAECPEPEYEELDSCYYDEYVVLMPKSLYDGGNNYKMFKTSKSTWISSGLSTAQVLASHIKKIEYYIHTGNERRIEFVESSGLKD